SYELSEQISEKCSDLYVNNENQTGIYHNEDGSDEVKFFVCNYDDETILDLSCHSALHGTTFSATKNIMFSINYIYNLKYNLNADFPTWIFTRLILTCKNIKEVEEVLKKFSIWGSVSINLLDVKANKLYSIEKHSNVYSIKEIKRIYFKTNTFTHEEMQKYSKTPKEVNTSLTRYNKIKELLKANKLTYEQIILYNNGDDYDSVRVTGQNRNNSKTQATVYFSKEKIEIIKDNQKQTYLVKDILN
ncbi:MAG: C45 family peptidase, partial [Clostridia bacterium]|nr:C45 family peptidase [Clostridia bacterium]